MNYKIYVINLKHRVDRKKFFLDHNQTFFPIFFDAIIGQDLDSQPPEFFSAGSYGCALSHFKLWEKCIELNEPIIICEDDAILHPLLHELTQKFMNDDVDFIHFGCNYDSIVDVELSTHHRLISCFSNSIITEKDIDEFKSSHTDTHFFKLRNSFGMMCYLITPKGAKKLLSIDNIRELRWKSLYIPGLNRSINTYTLDCLLNYYYSKNDECEPINVYITLPPLAITQNDKTQSDCTEG